MALPAVSQNNSHINMNKESWENYRLVADEFAEHLGVERATKLLHMLKTPRLDFYEKLNNVLLSYAADSFNVTEEEIIENGRLRSIGRIRDVLFYVLNQTCGISTRQISRLYYTGHTYVHYKITCFKSYKKTNYELELLKVEEKMSSLARVLKKLFSHE